jgi:hypothetical protein
VRAMPKPPGDAIQPAAGMPTRGRAVKMSRNLGKQTEQASMDSQRLPASPPARDETVDPMLIHGPLSAKEGPGHGPDELVARPAGQVAKNPPRPELDSPISAKGRHPVPAPPPPLKGGAAGGRTAKGSATGGPPTEAPSPPPEDPAAWRQRTTFTCGSCRRE